MSSEDDSDNDAAIEVSQLCKRYHTAKGAKGGDALQSVSLTVPKGKIFGLLGPNGAGKSTLINILAGLVNKSSGTAKIWGYDIEQAPRQARLSIGIIPQELNFDPFFTPWDLLEQQAGFFGVPAPKRRTAEILEIMGLTDKAQAPTRALSGGMKRRLMVAKALVHNPPVLVLDEPTAGVDLELRQHLWGYVRKLNDLGTTIVLTTHYLGEAEELCDDIAILNHGQIIACDSKDALIARLEGKTLIVTLRDPLTDHPLDLHDFCLEQLAPNRLALTTRPTEGQIDNLLRALQQAGHKITDITTEQSDLEDIFLHLTRTDQTEDRGEP